MPFSPQNFKSLTLSEEDSYDYINRPSGQVDYVDKIGFKANDIKLDLSKVEVKIDHLKPSP